MTEPSDTGRGEGAGGPEAAMPEHPKGTLAILIIYGLMFVLGWAWVYFQVFLARGAPTG